MIWKHRESIVQETTDDFPDIILGKEQHEDRLDVDSKTFGDRLHGAKASPPYGDHDRMTNMRQIMKDPMLGDRGKMHRDMDPCITTEGHSHGYQHQYRKHARWQPGGGRF